MSASFSEDRPKTKKATSWVWNHAKKTSKSFPDEEGVQINVEHWKCSVGASETEQKFYGSVQIENHLKG